MKVLPGLLRSLSVLCLLAFACTPLAKAFEWTFKTQSGSVMYFVFTSPTNHVERYDLAQGKWLDGFQLTDKPTAFHVDSKGVYIAYSRSLWRRHFDGTNELPIYNTANAINGILSDDTFLFAFTPSYNTSYVTSIRKNDLLSISTWSNWYNFSGAYSIAPLSRKLYGVNGMTTAFSTIELGYTSSGYFGESSELRSDTGSFGSQSHTYVQPQEAYVLRQDNGIAYALPGLTSKTPIGGSFSDAAFTDAGSLVVLRGDGLYQYSAALLQTAYYRLPTTPQGLAIYGSNAFVFSADASIPQGVSITKVALANLIEPTADSAIDPETFNYLPDDIIQNDDNFFILSKQYRSIFTWSAAVRRYTGSLRLLNSPTHFTYSKTQDRFYLGYATGAINALDRKSISAKERNFTNLPLEVRGLQMADNRLFATDYTGAWGTHYVIDAAGVVLSSRDWSSASSEYIWNASRQKMYFFRDGTSPNDLLSQSISPGGELGSEVDSPYHGDYTFTHPIRISADGSTVFTGQGILFDADLLSFKGAISNEVTDACFQGGWLLTIRPMATETQLQQWNANFLFSKAHTLPGAPFRVFALTGNRILVFTTIGKALMTSLVYMDTGTIISSPQITTAPSDAAPLLGGTASFRVTATGASPSYQWVKSGIPIPGATGSTLVISDVSKADEALYQVIVSNDAGTTISDPASLVIGIPPSRLGNLSTRMYIDGGSNIGIAGFVISGSKPKKVLIRAAGPALKKYMDTPVLPDPVLQLFTQDGTLINSNDDWTASQAAAFSQVGAFEWAVGSKDAALICTLPPGNYTAQVSSKTGESGSAIVEVYELDAATNIEGKLTNISTRATVKTGNNVMITGFVIGGTKPEKVLIRSSGPALRAYGVTDALSDPKLVLYSSEGNTLATNDDWSSYLNSDFSSVGAFGWQAYSKDAAIVITLNPGSYTVHTSGTGTETGTSLVEVYELP